MILADLGAGSGEPVLARLDRHTPATFQRYHVTLLTCRAWLHAQRDGPEPSADLLAQAISRNAHTRSREKLDRMRQVRAALAPFDQAVDLDGIDAQLQAQL